MKILCRLPGAGSATTLRNHPEILDWVRFIHATTKWTTSVCTGSLILGAAGVSAGIDMALTLAEKLCGPQVAQTLQLGIEYDPNPPFDVGSPKKANPRIRDALLTRMEALFEQKDH